MKKTLKHTVYSILFAVLLTFIAFADVAEAQMQKTPEQKAQAFVRIRRKIDREVEKELRAQELRAAQENAQAEFNANYRSTPSSPHYSAVMPQSRELEPMAPLRSITQEVSERDGALRIMNKMTCEAASNSLCQQICKGDACEWPEPPCRDCFGTGSEVMRDVFVRLSPTYRSIKPIGDVSLIDNLLSRAMILVSQSSPYDFFNSSQDPGISPHLMAMCGSTNGFVAVLLDDDGRPSRALLAICSKPEGVSAALLERSDASDSHVLEPIQLKLTNRLVENRKP